MREDGLTSVIELVIAAALMGVVLTSGVLVVSTVSGTSSASNLLGQSSQAAQVNLDEVANTVSSTTPPASAYLASALTSVSYACWGWVPNTPSKDPNGQTGAPASGASIFGTSATSEGALVAHDFEYQFCGFRPGTSVPHVYDLSINLGTCVGVGFCTLQLMDDGQYGDSTGRVVYSIPDVWCDSYCRADINAGGTNTSSLSSSGTQALFTYYSGTGTNLLTGDDTSAPSSNMLSGIETVEIQMTVLANTNNTNMPVATGGTPGTSLVQQVRLLGMGG